MNNRGLGPSPIPRDEHTDLVVHLQERIHVLQDRLRKERLAHQQALAAALQSDHDAAHGA